MRALRGVFVLVLALALPAPVLAADFQAGLEAYDRGDYALWVRMRLCWTLDESTLERRELIDAMTRFHLETEPAFDAKVLVRQLDACLAFDALERLGRIAAPALVLVLPTPLSAALRLAWSSRQRPRPCPSRRTRRRD